MARIQSWHDFEPEEEEVNIDELERGQGNLERMADGEQEIMGHKKILSESGLLERIEKRRLELKNEVRHKFGLYPRLNYRDFKYFHIVVPMADVAMFLICKTIVEGNIAGQLLQILQNKRVPWCTDIFTP